MSYTVKSFTSCIFLPNRNIKVKNYKDFENLKPVSLTKALNKGFGFTKVDVPI